MPTFTIRTMRQPDDYAAVAPLLNLIWSEPTTAERLQRDEDSIPPGKLHYNEDGELMGWDGIVPNGLRKTNTDEWSVTQFAGVPPGRNPEP